MDKETEMKKLKILEDKNKEEKNRRRFLILVLGITTIIIALVGASFAWFAVTVNNINGNESLVVKATVLEGVTFQASDNLVLTNALPGEKVETTFTITNPNADAKARYSLKFIADINEFTNEAGDGQLLVTVLKVNSDEAKVMDFTNGQEKKEAQIVTNVELLPGKSNVYKATLEFADIGKNQISNQNKTFVGHIEITQSIAVE